MTSGNRMVEFNGSFYEAIPDASEGGGELETGDIYVSVYGTSTGGYYRLVEDYPDEVQ